MSGSLDDERNLYGDTAEFYERHRPRYPTSILDRAFSLACLSSQSQILEIGCGPGTATVPMLQRGFNVTCVEPSSGMLAVAKRVCQSFENVLFEEATFQEFESSENSFDAIVAATSFHWAIEGDSISKARRLLKSDGSLVLLWNLPPEPELTILNAVAAATGRPKPFYFGDFSESEHRFNIRTKVLDRIDASQLFNDFSHDELRVETTTSPESYLAFVQTLSPYIRMSKCDREEFLTKAKQTFAECGEQLTVSNICILNVALLR